MNGSPAGRGVRRGVPGLERTCWVRLEHDRGRLRAHVAGISHGRPVVRPIPTPLAGRLIADGVPVVVHRDGDGPRADATVVAPDSVVPA